MTQPKAQPKIERKYRKNTRVAVTLTPESLALLTEISEVMKQSKSALVAELVDAALPAIQTTLAALKIVKEQPREAQRLMANYAAKATMELAQEQLDFDAQVDARTVKGRALKRRAGGRASP